MISIADQAIARINKILDREDNKNDQKINFYFKTYRDKMDSDDDIEIKKYNFKLTIDSFIDFVKLAAKEFPPIAIIKGGTDIGIDIFVGEFQKKIKLSEKLFQKFHLLNENDKKIIAKKTIEQIRESL